MHSKVFARVAILMLCVALALMSPAAAFAVKPVKPPKPPKNAGSISGVLSDTMRPGGPIEGGTVELYHYKKKAWRVLDTTVSDATGSFSFPAVSEGTYRLGFTSADYHGEFYDDAAAVDAATDVVVVQDTDTPVSAVLAPRPKVLELVASLQMPTNTQRWMAVDRDHDAYYIIDDVGTVNVVDGATKSLATQIALEGQPSGLAIDETRDRLYVLSYSSTTIVEVYSTVDHSLVETIPLPTYGNKVAVNPNTNRLYWDARGGDWLLGICDLTTGEAWVHQMSPMVPSTMSKTVWDIDIDPVNDWIYVIGGYGGGQYVHRLAGADESFIDQPFGFWGWCYEMDYDPVRPTAFVPDASDQGNGIYDTEASKMVAYNQQPPIHGIGVDDASGAVFGIEEPNPGVGPFDLSYWDWGNLWGGGPQWPSDTYLGLAGDAYDVEVNENTGEIAVTCFTGQVYFLRLVTAP